MYTRIVDTCIMDASIMYTNIMDKFIIEYASQIHAHRGRGGQVGVGKLCVRHTRTQSRGPKGLRGPLNF